MKFLTATVEKFLKDEIRIKLLEEEAPPEVFSEFLQKSSGEFTK